MEALYSQRCCTLRPVCSQCCMIPSTARWLTSSGKWFVYYLYSCCDCIGCFIPVWLMDPYTKFYAGFVFGKLMDVNSYKPVDMCFEINYKQMYDTHLRRICFTRPPIFLPPTMGFTRLNDGWMGICIKPWSVSVMNLDGATIIVQIWQSRKRSVRN